MDTAASEQKWYKIGAISKATGLTVHNLRIWEKRYQAISVERTHSGRRLYGEADLKRLMLLKRCVDQGMAISTIAGCSDPELQHMLAELGVSEPASANNERSWSVCTLGVDALHYLLPIAKQLGWHFDAEHFLNMDILKDRDQSRAIDLLFMDLPSLNFADVQQLAALIKSLNVHRVIIVYRYARQQDIAYLKTLGIEPLKAPLDSGYLRTLLQELLQLKKNPASLLPAQAPTRRFSDLQLSRAASISSSIECECPQHLAEIIRSLIAFESYSSKCESLDKTSRDLHHHIYLKSAEARAAMETLMQSVLEQEGINLDIL